MLIPTSGLIEYRTPLMPVLHTINLFNFEKAPRMSAEALGGHLDISRNRWNFGIEETGKVIKLYWILLLAMFIQGALSSISYFFLIVLTEATFYRKEH